MFALLPDLPGRPLGLKYYKEKNNLHVDCDPRCRQFLSKRLGATHRSAYSVTITSIGGSAVDAKVPRSHRKDKLDLHDSRQGLHTLSEMVKISISTRRVSDPKENFHPTAPDAFPPPCLWLCRSARCVWCAAPRDAFMDDETGGDSRSTYRYRDTVWLRRVSRHLRVLVTAGERGDDELWAGLSL